MHAKNDIELPGLIAPSAIYATVWRHWAARRDGASPPRRETIRLLELGMAAYNVHLMEWDGGERLRYSFGALDSLSRAGDDLFGKNHFELVNPAMRDGCRRAYADIFQYRAGSLMDYRAGEDFIQIMFLPLLNGVGDVRAGIVTVDPGRFLLADRTSLGVLEDLDTLVFTPFDLGHGVPWPERTLRI